MNTEKTFETILQEIDVLKSLFTESASAEPQFENKFLKLTEQEISKMPKKFRKTFRTQGCTVHVRKRQDERYNCSYEIRYAKKPFNNPPISVSATTLEVAKARFIEKLNSYVPQEENAAPAPAVPKDFHGFAMFWFENFHAARVVEKTFKNNFALYERHIKPRFGGQLLSDITPAALKSFLKGLPGNGKTADDAKSILNQIFETAINNGKLSQNPFKLFVHIPHERENGIELTQDEEIKLLKESQGTDYEIIYAVALYTGLRPVEYKTARIEGDFIVAQNSKRKQGKYEEKKIPICSHLRKILKDCEKLPKRHENKIRINFRKIMPNHTLKDLRKTFSTRCINCHVDFYAREKFMGHSVGKLDKPYVGNIDSYLLAEGKKLDNWYDYPNLPQN